MPLPSVPSLPDPSSLSTIGEQKAEVFLWEGLGEEQVVY